MRVLMLGWEFPPFIAGGLGTACHGLTKALDRRGHRVTFVLPRPVDRAQASHIRLLSPEGTGVRLRNGGDGGVEPGPANGSTEETEPMLMGFGSGHGEAEVGLGSSGPLGLAAPAFSRTTFLALPARFRSPYGSGGAVGVSKRSRRGPRLAERETQGLIDAGVDPGDWWEDVDWEQGHSAPAASASGSFTTHGAGPAYAGDLFAEADRYARLAVALTRGQLFDVIHAHDWLTFPAGLALSRVSGKPLVVHVHSTEFDRSGEAINSRVYDVERRGMLGAVRVIAVSNYTKSICVNKYGIGERRVEVVYNGIDSEEIQPHEGDRIDSKDKIVLFLGRVTMQKGPEYFIAAAKRVLEKVPDAKFVVAGSGDMAVRMVELAAHMGIGHRVLFAGFLRGRDVDRMYRMADCYVMPSVSEPFGLAPLEAIKNDVPVIISRQSGVSEVLSHALKVDFWDVDDIANKIVAVLRHPPLGQTLRHHGAFELRRLTWDGAAEKVEAVYRLVTAREAAPLAWV